jgi:hypothetical protein
LYRAPGTPPRGKPAGASNFNRVEQIKTPPEAGLRGVVCLAGPYRAAFTSRQGVMSRREILSAASLFLNERVMPMMGLMTL